MAASVIATTVTTPVTRKMSVFVGNRDCTGDVLWPSLRLSDAGKNAGSFSVTLDQTLANMPELHEQSPVLVIDHVSTPETMFRGFVKEHHPILTPGQVGGWARTEIRATDHGEALDNYIPGPEVRPAESAAARIGYLWGRYANHWLSPDLTNVTISASLAAQTFTAVTLRRALDMIVTQAAPTTGAWYLDQVGRLHAYTSETNAAPYNVDADAPGAGEMAPHDLDIEYDAGTYRNAIYVNGANAAGSGWVYDHAAIAQAGGSVFSGDPIDAPDCDTAAKRDNLGLMYLGRVATSAVRGRFTAFSPKDGWRAGQTLLVTSAKIGITNYSTRVERVETTLFTSDASKRRYAVDFGRVRGESSASDSSSSGFAGTIGGVIGGTITDDDGNVLLSTETAGGAASSFGPSARRYIQSGIENGDFHEAPLSADATITDANPLPKWTYVQASGTSITARSVTDSSSGSGRAIEFSMASGAASDDTYIETLIPIIASRTRGRVYLPSGSFKTGPTVSTAQMYVSAQYLTEDEAATGTANTEPVTTTSVGANTLRDIQALPADKGQVPADAYFLRLRVGFKRNTAATTVTETVTLYETWMSTGGPQSVVVEGVSPATYGYGVMYQQGGALFLAANQGQANTPSVALQGADGSVIITADGTYGPILRLNGANGEVKITTFNDAGIDIISGSGQAPFLKFHERTDPAAPATNEGALYLRDNGAGKAQLVVRFNTGAVQVIATEP